MDSAFSVTSKYQGIINCSKLELLLTKYLYRISISSRQSPVVYDVMKVNYEFRLADWSKVYFVFKSNVFYFMDLVYPYTDNNDKTMIHCTVFNVICKGFSHRHRSFHDRPTVLSIN